MIEINMPQSCMDFLLLYKLTQSTILRSQKHDSTKWRAVLVHDIKGKPCNTRHICVDRYILLLKHLSNHMHFITKGFKRFS